MGYSPCFSEKSNFFIPFCTISSSYKIGQCAKTDGQGYFNNFSVSRYDISLTVGPISMIIFANSCKFHSLFILIKNRFLKIIFFEKHGNVIFHRKKNAKLATVQNSESISENGHRI